jgi:hypothetical protein
MNTASAQLRQLLTRLPDESVAPVTTYVRGARDPMLAVLGAAPYDDEPLSDEERRQVEASERAIAAGEPLMTTEEVEAWLDAERDTAEA